MTASKPPLALTHARVVTPVEEIEDGTVVLAGGRIVSVGREKPPAEAETLDLRGQIVAPGFIDLHVHGGGGFSLIGGDPAEVHAYARWAVSRGVTSFLISLVPGEREELVRRIRAAAAGYRRDDGGGAAAGLPSGRAVPQPEAVGRLRGGVAARAGRRGAARLS